MTMSLQGPGSKLRWSTASTTSATYTGSTSDRPLPELALLGSDKQAVADRGHPDDILSMAGAVPRETGAVGIAPVRIPVRRRRKTAFRSWRRGRQ
jgi:hypothetical protein